MADEETGWGYEAPSYGAIVQLTTHATRKVPKKEPIGFRLVPSKKQTKETDA